MLIKTIFQPCCDAEELDPSSVGIIDAVTIIMKPENKAPKFAFASAISIRAF